MFITDIHSLGRRPVRRHPVHRRVVLELRRRRTRRGPTASRRRRTPVRPSPTPPTTPPPCNYLEAVQEAGTDDADAVVAKLEGKKINDVFLRNGEIRAADHRVIHDVYLAKVKSKDQVKEEWDYEEIVKTIPAAEAFGPVSARLQDVT